MGPGANAEADEAVLSSVFPNVFFWNQPPQKKQNNAFQNLVDAAENEVKKMIALNGGRPVNVMAHSFGGHLFHHLSLRAPELFSSCVFYGTGYDIPGGFLKLLKIMAQDPSTSSELKEKMAPFLNSGAAQPGEIWNYIGLIAQDPAFFRHYWPTENLFSSFVAVASKTEPMDMESFQNILNDFLANHFKPESPPQSLWQGPLEIFFGDKDPLIDISRESGLWTHIFPQARIKVLENSGHFIHLEKYLKA